MGIGYIGVTGFNTVLPPNAPICESSKGEWSDGLFPPQSRHPAGVLASLADGSVRFISENIDTGDLALPEPTGWGIPVTIIRTAPTASGERWVASTVVRLGH